MIFHAVKVNQQFQALGVTGRIIIKSPDTDVLVLCVQYFSKLPNISEMWFETGTCIEAVNQHRFISTHEVCSTISNPLCQSLPAIHAITGCDSTSAYFGLATRLCSI
jgi:hypothetical protein